MVGATATPAAAKPVNPHRNEGWISITARTCGTSNGWQNNAHRNGSSATNGWLLPYRTVDVRCAGLTTNAARRPAPKVSHASSARISRVIAFALAQIGEPYRYGAAGPHAWDCSGLMLGAYRTVGISLPHWTGTLIHRGRPVSRAQLRPGDLVFLSRHHVGLYIGGNRMIVAPHTGARVRIQTVYSFYAARRIL